MKMKIKWLILLLLFTTLPLMKGQEAKYLIKNYDLQSSLNLNGSVWCMVQDTIGILYFGVEGAIVTYNGTEWSFFPNNKEVIRSLFIDSGGNIWYGTVNDFGRVKRSPSEGLILESVMSLFPEDIRHFGELWTISEVNSKVFFQSKNYIFVYKDDNHTACYRVGDCYHRGFSVAGQYLINETDKGLSYFTTEGFKLLKGGEFFRGKVLSGAIELSADSLLLGSREEGVFLYNMNTGLSVPYFNQESFTSSFLSQNRIYHMLQLPDKTIAFATLLNGTLITTPQGKFLKTLHYQSGVQDNTHYFLGTSDDSNLWMCTGNGISSYYIYSPFSNWDYGKGVEGVVMSIQNHLDGILVGTLTGLFLLPDPNNIDEKVERLLNSEVWDIFPLKINKGQEIKVISSGNGLYELTGKKLKQVYKGELILKTAQLNADPSIILSFSANHLHVSRMTEGGIKYLSSISGLFSEFRSMAQEGNISLWIGTRSLRMIRISQKELLRTILKDQNTVNFGVDNFTFTTLTDAHNINGKTIFSNNTGFLVYDSIQRSFNRCNSFGPEVAAYSRMVTAMTPDPKGNIWIGGNELLLNRQDGTYSPHHLPFEPVRDIFSAFAFYHDEKGQTWIGGNRGLYLYDNRTVHPSGNCPPIIIDRIVKDDSIHYVTLNKCSEANNGILSFNNGKNITIYYSLPCYSGKYITEYSYLLEGYSEGWSKWSTKYFLNFNNLPAGDYMFRIKGKTPAWESDQTCIAFTIKRQWYNSVYARISYLVIIGIILYSINTISINRRVRQELLIENMIQKRVNQGIMSGLIPGNRKAVYLANDVNEESFRGEGPESLNNVETGDRGQLFMNNLLDAIEDNIGDCELSVEKLCAIMKMSQTMLYRKLKAYTGLSITSFVRKIRLKKGAQLLLHSDMTISEIAYKVGFNDPGYFTKCFHQEFGKSPKNFQKNPDQQP